MGRSFFINIGAGYFLKLIQIISGLITVPILTNDSGLGLTGYGQLIAGLASVSLLSMILDGFRLVASRRMGAKNVDLYQEYNRCLLLHLSLMGVMVFPILYDPFFFIQLLGVFESELFVKLLVLYFLFEQTLYLMEQYFHTLFKSYFVSYLNIAESLIRLVLIYYLFGCRQSGQVEYMLIFSATYAVKCFFYSFKIAVENGSKNILLPTASYIKDFMFESLPLSFKGGLSFLVFRLSVVYVNKYLSSDVAAVFSIIFVTIRGYLAQIFVNVVRPMVIPALSSEIIRDMSNKNKKRILDLIATFELFTLISVSLIAVSSIYWLELWLGSDFVKYCDLFVLSIFLLGIEVAYSIKTLTIISQGDGRRLTEFSLFFCFIYVILFMVLHWYQWVDLRHVVTIVGFYLVLNNGWGVNYLFRGVVLGGVMQYFVFLSYLVSSLLSYILLFFQTDENAYLLGSWLFMVAVMVILSWPSLVSSCKRLLSK